MFLGGPPQELSPLHARKRDGHGAMSLSLPLPARTNDVEIIHRKFREECVMGGFVMASLAGIGE